MSLNAEQGSGIANSCWA